jgi:hypothetical protein
MVARFGTAPVLLWACTLLPCAGRQQAPGAAPAARSVCELAKTPETLNGKIVSVRGRVLIGFEEFMFSTADCASRKVNGIWLEYGRGPKRQPTIWCCGDMVPRDALAIVQNQEFQRFHRQLTAQSRRKGCHAGECHLYDVTATLTGRLDVADLEPGPKGTSVCPNGGFGHFGVSCARLVIESVSDVVAKPVAQSGK